MLLSRSIRGTNLRVARVVSTAKSALSASSSSRRFTSIRPATRSAAVSFNPVISCAIISAFTNVIVGGRRIFAVVDFPLPFGPARMTQCGGPCDSVSFTGLKTAGNGPAFLPSSSFSPTDVGDEPRQRRPRPVPASMRVRGLPPSQNSRRSL